ncbi:MAG: hypothetical protein ACRESR_02575 [Gammaproteobacteria bacterium]
MRLIILSLCAGVALLASAGALANRPVATLPSGAIVDLNTGIVTTADGQHYKLSAARLEKLRARLAEGNARATVTAGGGHRLAPAAATATPGKAKGKSGEKEPPL